MSNGLHRAMLEVRDLKAFYGKSQILHGVDLTVGEREIVSILGRNGTGRSTTLKAIMGSVRREGVVRFRGEGVHNLKPYQIARRGLGFVPEERAIFPNLTVEQNLLLGEKAGAGNAAWTISDTWALFPQLRERASTPAGVLSGGEQQMLTICRTLMGNPSLIMIDEPTEGLAPQMVERVGILLAEIAQRGIAILLVEQKLTIALHVSHRLYVMGHGRMVFEGSTAAFKADRSIQAEWLEV
jgi:branched-chain amino acid transport system ATP-binding protein